MSRAGERVFYANMTSSAKQIDLEKTLFLSVLLARNTGVTSLTAVCILLSSTPAGPAVDAVSRARGLHQPHFPLRVSSCGFC